MVRYDLDRAKELLAKSVFCDRVASLWRYRELLPLQSETNLISIGEGYTPLLDAKNLAIELGIRQLWIKDEAQNPTGSFKDRGLSVAISRAKELGVAKAAIPSAGNAGGSFAAYAARAGIEAHVFMPRDTPMANQVEAAQYGARLSLVDGLINDCGRIISERKAAEGDRKSTRLNSSHVEISYADFCSKKKKENSTAGYCRRRLHPRSGRRR